MKTVTVEFPEVEIRALAGCIGILGGILEQLLEDEPSNHEVPPLQSAHMRLCVAMVAQGIER